MRFGPLPTHPHGQFIGSDHGSIIVFGDFQRIPHVIVMAVGEENIIHLNILGIRLRHRISPQERIDHQSVPFMVNFKTAVTVIADLHVKNPFPLVSIRMHHPYSGKGGVPASARLRPGGKVSPPAARATEDLLPTGWSRTCPYIHLGYPIMPYTTSPEKIPPARGCSRLLNQAPFYHPNIHAHIR